MASIALNKNKKATKTNNPNIIKTRNKFFKEINTLDFN